MGEEIGGGGHVLWKTGNMRWNWGDLVMIYGRTRMHKLQLQILALLYVCYTHPF